MPLKQLTFTPSAPALNEHEPQDTYILMVDEELYRRRQSDPGISNALVVDNMELLKKGGNGQLKTVKKDEMEQMFGTMEEESVIEFMLQHGKLSDDPI